MIGEMSDEEKTICLSRRACSEKNTAIPCLGIAVLVREVGACCPYALKENAAASGDAAAFGAG